MNIFKLHFKKDYKMLKYEEKLGLDKKHEKLQKSNVAKTILSIIEGILEFSVSFFVIRYLLMFVKDIQPWQGSAKLFEFFTIPIYAVDCVYFAVGLVICCIANVMLARITEENHSAKDQNTEDTVRLLTTGYYAKLRHPMYGTFILLQASVLLSLRSLIGILLTLGVIALQYYNAVTEENKKLIVTFKDSYTEYTQTTRRMLLNNTMIIVLAVMICASAIGFLFKL